MLCYFTVGSLHYGRQERSVSHVLSGVNVASNIQINRGDLLDNGSPDEAAVELELSMR